MRVPHLLCIHMMTLSHWPFLECFALAGGFAKAPGVPPDLLHTFYSLSWLSLAGEAGVQEEMDVALGVASGTAERLGRYRAKSSAARWKEQSS